MSSFHKRQVNSTQASLTPDGTLASFQCQVNKIDDRGNTWRAQNVDNGSGAVGHNPIFSDPNNFAAHDFLVSQMMGSNGGGGGYGNGGGFLGYGADNNPVDFSQLYYDQFITGNLSFNQYMLVTPGTYLMQWTNSQGEIEVIIDLIGNTVPHTVLYADNGQIIYSNYSGLGPGAAQSSGGIDFSNSSFALDIGGGIYGGLQGLTSSQGYWLGKNGKYSSDSWGGNRYTGSRSGAYKAASNYKWAGRATVVGSALLGGYLTYEGYVADGGQFGYNAQMAAASSAGSILGGLAGAEAGAAVGAAIGVWFGGVGAIPGAVIGGVIGGFGFGMAGGYYGGQLGGSAVNYYHGR